MPYIKKEEREIYAENLGMLLEDLDEQGFSMGHVTYVVYCIVGRWFTRTRKFQTIGEIRGMLASVLSEFDRQLGCPYENEKINDNGDIDHKAPYDEVIPTFCRD